MPHFIDEVIEPIFDTPPALSKTPDCPDGFVWRGETLRVAEKLAEWRDYGRRGRMARNMAPAHASVAAHRGSWGVGRFYFRVRAADGRKFELYYDRAPRGSDHPEGAWVLTQELD